MYGDVRSWVFGDAVDFTYSLRSAAGPRLATAHMRFSMGFGIDADLDPAHHTFLVMIGGDHYRLASQYGEAVLRPGDVAVAPAGARLEVSLHALEVVTLSVPAAEIAQVACELYDVGDADLAVRAMSPVSAAAAGFFRRVVALSSHELLKQDSAFEHPLLLDAAVRALGAGFLGAFATSATASPARRGPDDLTPRGLRRAVAFIDAHAADPISLGDIAAAAGTSPRAVQHAFARHRGTTPMAYLRRVRLEGAHRDLQAADPATGPAVAEIARRWDYADRGRFARAYREAFGVSPRQTLWT